MSVWIVPSALQHMPWASMTCACHALHTTDLCRAHVCDSSAAGAGGMPHISSAQSRHGSRNARRCAGRWSRARLQSQAHGLPFCGVLVSCRAMPVNIAQTHRCAHGEAGSGFSGGLTCNSFPEPCRSRYGAGGKDWRHAAARQARHERHAAAAAPNNRAGGPWVVSPPSFCTHVLPNSSSNSQNGEQANKYGKPRSASPAAASGPGAGAVCTRKAGGAVHRSAKRVGCLKQRGKLRVHPCIQAAAPEVCYALRCSDRRGRLYCAAPPAARPPCAADSAP